MSAKIAAVSLNPAKGQPKENQAQIKLIVDYGVQGDAHAGDPIRQVSLLALESIQKMQALGAEVSPGSFGENITTVGLEIGKLRVGDLLKAGSRAVLQISQLGKTCHSPCAIYYQAGTCIMPREGVFAKVLQGGMLRPGDSIQPQ